MVIILRGISGSGKSTIADLLSSKDFKFKIKDHDFEPAQTPAIAFAHTLWKSFIDREHKFHKLSSDDFYMVNGVYKFEAKLLSTAHGTCLRAYHEAVVDPKAVIVVDNTNCTVVEVTPYAALANAFAMHELQIITLLTPPDVAWRRNKHNVPFNKVVQQAFKLQDSILNWPSFYPQQIFPE